MASKKDVLLGILGVASAGLTGGPLGAVSAGLNLTRRREPDKETSPVIVREHMVEDLAQPDDATKGAAFAASSIRLVLHRTIPDEALEWIDRFCLRWSQMAFETEPVKSPGQKAYEDSPVSEGKPWDDVAEPTQQAWESYAKRRGME